MERLRRVTRLWSWLPAFRAVAETQHLPTASRQLFVSASALSRTIKLLEQDVGHRLFSRNGRRIELNESGERFLVAVRTAMRIVHDGLVALEGSELRGPVYVSTTGLATTAYLLPGLSRLRERQPSLVPHVSHVLSSEVNGRLQRGEIDVAIVTHPIDCDELTKTHLGCAKTGIYCGEDHPLFTAETVSLETLSHHPFAALTPDTEGRSVEAWPPAVERRVGIWVDQQALALQLCTRGQYLAVLPHAVGEPEVRHQRLRRLPLSVTADVDVFAMTRPVLGVNGRAEAVVGAVADVIRTTDKL
ncbi:MAG: LysR family transcriptional regulator [Nannocystaceae bacterium]|nr:LysR family transcriptional regulator [Nannocystaceae bacterium]